MVDDRDPTTDGDAAGYLLHLASLSAWNGREEALAEKCAEYLRSLKTRALAAEARLAEARSVLRACQYADDGGPFFCAICKGGSARGAITGPRS
jgi:hypothetical protein